MSQPPHSNSPGSHIEPIKTFGKTTCHGVMTTNRNSEIKNARVMWLMPPRRPASDIFRHISNDRQYRITETIKYF